MSESDRLGDEGTTTYFEVCTPFRETADVGFLMGTTYLGLVAVGLAMKDVFLVTGFLTHLESIQAGMAVFLPALWTGDES